MDEEDEKARRELVKLATEYGMYFVVWYGHFGNYFVGLRNTRNKKPEVYAALYEMFNDMIRDDEILFSFDFNMKNDGVEERLPWVEFLQEAEPWILRSIVKDPALSDAAKKEGRT